LINWDALQAFDELQADFALDADIDNYFSVNAGDGEGQEREPATVRETVVEKQEDETYDVESFL
jgi:hypothetical protein